MAESGTGDDDVILTKADIAAMTVDELRFKLKQRGRLISGLSKTQLQRVPLQTFGQKTATMMRKDFSSQTLLQKVNIISTPSFPAAWISSADILSTLGALFFFNLCIAVSIFSLIMVAGTSSLRPPTGISAITV